MRPDNSTDYFDRARRTGKDNPFEHLSSIDIEMAVHRMRSDAIASALARAAAAVGRAARRLIAAICDRQARQRIQTELMALSDRELSDIGLSRADIPSVANGTFVPRHGKHYVRNDRTRSPSKAA